MTTHVVVLEKNYKTIKYVFILCWNCTSRNTIIILKNDESIPGLNLVRQTRVSSIQDSSVTLESKQLKNQTNYKVEELYITENTKTDVPNLAKDIYAWK